MSQLAEMVFVSVKNGRLERLNINDLLYVEAAGGGGVRLVLKQRSYQLQTNLGTIEAQLPTSVFWRVSRQHLVNLAHIEGYETGHLWLEGDHKLPIGPQYRTALLAKLTILRTKLLAQR